MYLIDREHMLPLYEFEGYEDPDASDEELSEQYLEVLSEANVRFAPTPLDPPRKVSLVYTDLPPLRGP